MNVVIESTGKVGSRARVGAHELVFDQPANVPGGEATCRPIIGHQLGGRFDSAVGGHFGVRNCTDEAFERVTECGGGSSSLSTAARLASAPPPPSGTPGQALSPTTGHSSCSPAVPVVLPGGSSAKPQLDIAAAIFSRRQRRSAPRHVLATHRSGGLKPTYGDIGAPVDVVASALGVWAPDPSKLRESTRG
jgi:hypothetical protein